MPSGRVGQGWLSHGRRKERAMDGCLNLYLAYLAGCLRASAAAFTKRYMDAERAGPPRTASHGRRLAHLHAVVEPSRLNGRSQKARSVCPETASRMPWIAISPISRGRLVAAAPLHTTAALNTALQMRPTLGQIFSNDDPTSNRSGSCVVGITAPLPGSSVIGRAYLWCTAAHSASVRR